MKRGRHRHDNEMNEDRLSALPDSVLHHILSFSDAKQAAQSCILSTRWKNLWKTLPALKLTSSQFTTIKAFTKFVSRVNVKFHRQRTFFPNSLNLPALINLSLEHFIFCVNDDGRVNPFSSLNRLNSLNLYRCDVNGNRSLCISNATLANLTIHSARGLNWTSKNFFQLSTPSLCTFVFSGSPSQKLCGSLSNLSSVKHVEIDAHCGYKPENTPLVLLDWLIELSNTESLTVSMETLEVLSLVPDLLKVELPSLYSLKSLKVIQNPYSDSIPMDIVNFLLQNAPSAKVDTGELKP